MSTAPIFATPPPAPPAPPAAPPAPPAAPTQSGPPASPTAATPPAAPPAPPSAPTSAAPPSATTAPAAPPQSAGPPAPPAAPTQSGPPAPPMPGGTAVPGMQRPGAGSAGAGAGKHRLVLGPAIIVKGTLDLRPKRFMPPKDGKSPAIVFEVHDENEIAKGKRGEKHMNGGEVMVTLWGDRRTYDLFRAFGYSDDTWVTHADGNIELPIDRMLTEKPLATCEVSYKEGNTVGRGFSNIDSAVFKKARTT